MKKFDVIKVLIFFVLLCFIAVLNINTLLKNDGTNISYIDNKNIPTFNMPKNKDEVFTGSYFDSVNTVFIENFFRRDSFIEEYFIISRLTGKNIMNNILIDSNENLQYYFEALTEKENMDILNGLENLEKYFKNKNYYMFKIPSKNAVYKDLYYDYTIEEESIYVDELSNYIKDNLNINYYDLNDYIRGFKSMEIYYKTDHHWNNEGSFLGYEYIYNILSDDYNLSDKLNVVDIVGYSDIFSGSRARQIGYGYRNNQEKDDFYYNITDDINEYTMTIYGVDYKGDQSIFYFDEVLDYVDKYKNLYSLFMGSDYPFVDIVNETIDNEYKVLILKDSFTNPLIPYLASHFKNTLVVDLRYTDENIDYYIEKYVPDFTLHIFSNFKVMDMYNYK